MKGGDDRRLLLWKTAEIFDPKARNSPNVLHVRDKELVEIKTQILCLAFSNDGKSILSAVNSGPIIMNDIET